jgi:hypothetical protein
MLKTKEEKKRIRGECDFRAAAAQTFYTPVQGYGSISRHSKISKWGKKTKTKKQ